MKVVENNLLKFLRDEVSALINEQEFKQRGLNSLETRILGLKECIAEFENKQLQTKTVSID